MKNFSHSPLLFLRRREEGDLICLEFKRKKGRKGHGKGRGDAGEAVAGAEGDQPEWHRRGKAAVQQRIVCVFCALPAAGLYCARSLPVMCGLLWIGVCLPPAAQGKISHFHKQTDVFHKLVPLRGRKNLSIEL